MANYFTENEFREIEEESVAHATTARNLRSSVDKAIEKLNEDTAEDGSITEATRMEVIAILENKRTT